MKKIILTLCLLLLASTAQAAWTVTSSKVSKAGNYYKFKIILTSDGSSLTATDIITSNTSAEAIVTMPEDIRKVIMGQTFMRMKVVPGTGGVVPNGTLDISILDDEGDNLWADTGITQSSNTWHKLYEDLNDRPEIFEKIYLTFNDIGDSGDQVTLYFIIWVE
jgi:hypothetical protein